MVPSTGSLACHTQVCLHMNTLEQGQGLEEGDCIDHPGFFIKRRRVRRSYVYMPVSMSESM